MTKVTEVSAKSITSISGCKLYKLDEVQDQYTLEVPYGKIWAVFPSVIEATTAQYVSHITSDTSGQITFFVSSGAIDLDVMVFGE